jgi:hypothetical protein
VLPPASAAGSACFFLAPRFAQTVENYLSQKKRWWLRLHEETGKLNEMRCRHQLEEYLDASIGVAGLSDDRKGPLFRSAIGKTGHLSGKPLLRGDVWRMVRRRSADAGIETAIGRHTFRATGIADYLTNGGRIESRSAWPGTRTRKPRPSTTGANDDIGVGEVERIGI